MRIIVNDTSALIDLKKGGLLEALLELPFQLIVADAVLADELLSFTKKDIDLMRRKMKVASLDGGEIKAASDFERQFPALSFHDCMALVIAQREEGCMLLVGDRRLRAVAEARKIECHGVLWIVREMENHQVESKARLLKALQIWEADASVRLPKKDLSEAIARLRNR